MSGHSTEISHGLTEAGVAGSWMQTVLTNMLLNRLKKMWVLVCGCDHKLIGKAERFPEGPGLCSGSRLSFQTPA